MIFSTKISLKLCLFNTSLAALSHIDKPVFFALCLISILNDVDIQLILDFKISFENIIQYVLKILNDFFVGHIVDI